MTPRDVFVSYSQPDRGCAFELVEYLETRGIGCWIAPRDISPAADWAAEIIDAISAARVMVLVFSESGNDSPQVRREVERAVHKHLRILPFRIADVLPSKSLEYFLSAQHWLDAFPPPLQPHYARLYEYLTAALADRAQTARNPVAEQPLTAAQVPERADTDGLNASQLGRVEAQLADYVGPVARHLVKRAAARAANLEAIVNLLAGELESEQDRRQFVGKCLQSARSST